MDAVGADGASDMAGAGVGVWLAFGPPCFLAEARAGEPEGDGRDVGIGVAAAGTGECDADAVAGSGVMMLTGGVDAALGNSALVGLPVGTPGIIAATGATTGGTGAFQSTE